MVPATFDTLDTIFVTARYSGKEIACVALLAPTGEGTKQKTYPFSHWHKIAFSSLSESAVRFACRIIRFPFSSVASQSCLQGHYQG